MIVPAARQSEMIPLVGVKLKKKKHILFMYIYMVRMEKQQI